MTDKDTHKRRFWVVSPNVHFDSSTVSKWRQASVMWKAAFMGYSPDSSKQRQIGYKFAHVIQPDDILLIARSHHKKPEVVGFGVVDGKFKRQLTGFKRPQRFGSLRKLKPFRPQSAAPPKMPIMDALRQTSALHELHPDKNPNHKRICDWMERTLAKPWHRPQQREDPPDDPQPTFGPLSHNELEYEVRTRQKAKLAKKIEATLVRRYSEWLENQNHKVFIVKYKNLRCDAYEKDRANLIEAKCSARREYIRMAVGQLLDYAYLGRKRLGKPNMAILLPERPDPRSVEWLSKLHIFVVWKENDVFLDNANGLFT